ncbi:diaminopropionate ammonia-lyase [Fusarium sp. NRRL 52700]|nr:diaminopropionate ammonia-lyase [Fusarium sp. NRRL 52700]
MPHKQSFLQALAADEHSQTSFLQIFVQAASPNPPIDTSKATAVIGEYLSSKNIPYELADVNEDGKVNVVSDFQGGKGAGPHVVLNGHVDVFPVGDGSGWSRDPWSGDIVEGRLHGRGVVDMKSGTASLIIAYAFLYQHRHLLSGSVALCAVADEETGGKLGTKYLIEQDKRRWGGDLMLCAEPGGLETIRFAEKGTLRLTCTVKTKGALGPYLHLTKGAIRTATAFINEVIESVESLPVDLPVKMEKYLEKPEVKRAIDQAIGPGTTTIIARPTVNVGTIKGGLKVNMIPETCIFELDIRMPVGMREDTILELIDTIIPHYKPASIAVKKQAAASNPFNCSVIDHPIVGHLKDNAKSLRPDADAPIPIPSMGGSDCTSTYCSRSCMQASDLPVLLAPRGVLLSQQNSATLLRDGNVVEISIKDLMSKAHATFLMDTRSLHISIEIPYQFFKRSKAWLKEGIKLSHIQQKLTGVYYAAKVDPLAKNTIPSTLKLFIGPEGYSAMAKSDSLTCGIATQMLLGGEPVFNKPGVVAHYSQESRYPNRVRVEDEGTKRVEETFQPSQ